MTIMDIQHLRFARRNKVIFHDLTFSIAKGQFIGLLGPNGTGKTTLLKCLAGLLKGTGSIHLLNQPIHKMKPRDLAKMICYMPQNTHLETAFTVEEVVKMGRYPYKSRFSSWSEDDTLAVEHALTYTGLSHLKDRYVPTLSGGERQLVYLAKAISQDTPVLLLDEPTSDLDIRHQVMVTDILHRLKHEGKTIIASIHDLNLASRICDQCIYLREGNIVCFDTNLKAMTPETIKTTFHVKSHVYVEEYTYKKQIIPYEVC